MIAKEVGMFMALVVAFVFVLSFSSSEVNCGTPGTSPRIPSHRSNSLRAIANRPPYKRGGGGGEQARGGGEQARGGGDQARGGGEQAHEEGKANYDDSGENENNFHFACTEETWRTDCDKHCQTPNHISGCLKKNNFNEIRPKVGAKADAQPGKHVCHCDRKEIVVQKEEEEVEWKANYDDSREDDNHFHFECTKETYQQHCNEHCHTPNHNSGCSMSSNHDGIRPKIGWTKGAQPGKHVCYCDRKEKEVQIEEVQKEEEQEVEGKANYDDSREDGNHFHFECTKETYQQHCKEHCHTPNHISGCSMSSNHNGIRPKIGWTKGAQPGKHVCFCDRKENDVQIEEVQKEEEQEVEGKANYDDSHEDDNHFHFECTKETHQAGCNKYCRTPNHNSGCSMRSNYNGIRPKIGWTKGAKPGQYVCYCDRHERTA